MSILTDLRGSITAGKFYHDILTKPAKDGWRVYLSLIVVVSIVISIFMAYYVNSSVSDAIDFYSGIDKTVEFKNGEIVNMPYTHKQFKYNQLTIQIDRKYTSPQSLTDDMENSEPPIAFVGPHATYIFTKDQPVEIPYPAEFSQAVDMAYLGKIKSYATYGALILGFILSVIIKFCESLAYIALVIAPIILFKFRRRGLTYGEAFKIGLYPVSFQIIISTILMLAGLAYYWVPLLFIPFYIFYIGAYVNIDLSHSKRQLYQESSAE